MTQQEAERRVDQLARELNVKINYEPGRHPGDAETMVGQGVFNNRTIINVAPWSPDTWRTQYWIAMHELGHAATTPRDRDPLDNLVYTLGLASDILDIEARAWNWAREHGGDDIVGLASTAEPAMGSYYGALHDQRITPAVTELVEALRDVPVDQDLFHAVAPPHNTIDFGAGWRALAHTV